MNSSKVDYHQSPLFADGNSGNIPTGNSLPALSLQSGGPGGTPTTAAGSEKSRSIAMDGKPSKQRGYASPYLYGAPKGASHGV
jgi:hypothetical protein